MTNPTLTAAENEVFEAQTRRYGGHQFTTYRGLAIFIDEEMDLSTALAQHRVIKKDLATAERIGHFIRDHEENKLMIRGLQDMEQEARAQAMAAFYRAAQCWPKDAKDALGL